ncbi:hypothetical protein [Streptomyces sp. NPDC021356]|uniref:hypothetical protein n=1 Tax=Streptomyces sp. NPDC021356 TaxID=3154900 RepID=UPI0033D47809
MSQSEFSCLSAAKAALVPERDPDVIAAAAGGCPAVSRLSAGPFGAAAACLPGRRVAGVQVAGEVVRVHVVGRYGHAMAEIGAQVRDAVAAVAPGAVVDVVIEDLDLGDLPPGG